MKDVRRLGAEIAEAYDRIDGLLNNAGTFSGDYTGKRVVTEEGNEYSLAVNVLAPFLLTSLLLDRVRASGNGRILVTSSMSAGAADALNDLCSAKSWSEHRAYSLSKLCCAMIAMELNARYGDPPSLCIHTMDPGTVNTKMLIAGWGRCGIPVAQATRSYHMLVDESYGRSSGECAGTGLNREAKDPAARQKLWDDLTERTGRPTHVSDSACGARRRSRGLQGASGPMPSARRRRRQRGAMWGATPAGAAAGRPRPVAARRGRPQVKRRRRGPRRSADRQRAAARARGGGAKHHFVEGSRAPWRAFRRGLVPRGLGRLSSRGVIRRRRVRA